MARKPRLHYPGAFYHVMLRGNGGGDIFFSDDDRYHFFTLVQEGIERYSHRIHTFCQMTNHIHLIVQVGEISLSRVMQNLSFRYTRFINARQKRFGHLFQGRYKAILIDSNSYLLELVRYIHCNPVRAKIMKNPVNYQWSSHSAYLGEKAFSWLTTDFVLSQFGENQKTAIRLYLDFVEAGMNEGYRAEFHTGLSGGRILGDKKFSEKVLSLADEKSKTWWTHDQMIGSICLIYKIGKEMLCEPSKRQPAAEARAVAAYLVQENECLSLTHLGTILGRDVSALSRASGRIRDRLKEDPELEKKVAAIKKQIEQISKYQA